MNVADYDDFVQKTEQYSRKKRSERHAIALYGLVGEIGSLVSAVKKKILAEGGETGWDQPNEEIKEEIGDVLWYCYSLTHIVNAAYFDILAHDISLLENEIGGENERAQRIGAALDSSTRDEFLQAAQTFPPEAGFSFDDYQRLAFKTARTDGRVLLEVCLAVLWQLGAELLRATLPKIELTLNRNVADRPVNTVLGEIAWHLSAIASLYQLSMDDVVAFNQEKVKFRSERGAPTPLHDEGRDPREQFPRSFDVAFVRVSPRKSRMYFQGKRLGDDLTDNAYEDDGYRFHDVLHLALIAHLGWSPVVREMMKRKRKSRNDGVDEVEDGGRAKVVEELVLKAIHSEGERQAKDGARCSADGPTRIFPDRSVITFRLLKTLRTYVDQLEVWKNAYWEWENAIFEGCEVFFRLRVETQGTVSVDLRNRELRFSPVVAPDLSGATVGLGMATVDEDWARDHAQTFLTSRELKWAQENGCLARTFAAKKAIVEALGFTEPALPIWQQIDISLLEGNRVCVKIAGDVQERAWSLNVVDYKTAFTASPGRVICTAAAIADLNDIRR